jgi:hypothetical protein
MSAVEKFVDLLLPVARAAVVEGMKYEESASEIIKKVPKLKDNKFFEEFYVYIFRAANDQEQQYGYGSELSHDEAIAQLQKDTKGKPIPRHRPAQSTITKERFKFGISPKRIAERATSEVGPRTKHTLSSALLQLAKFHSENKK